MPRKPLSNIALGAALTAFSSLAFGADRAITIETDDPEVTLAGTLSVPEEGEGPFPGVLLLSGSGAQDRDSALFGKRPLGVLAEALTARGYAVLRCDDRGVGDSTGVFEGTTIDEFVSDAKHMMKVLSLEEDVDWKRTFALGHSEGAGVAAALGAEGIARSGVVMLGGTAVPGHMVLTDQSVRLSRAQGADEEKCTAIETAHRALMQALLDDEPEDVLRERTMDLVRAQAGDEAPEGMLAMVLPQAMAQFDDPWFERFLEHNPTEWVERLRVPGLAVYGGVDQQVSDEMNAAPMSDALARMRHPASRVMVFPGRNHFFQRARLGTIEEYATLEADLDPDVAHAIADWMDSVIDRND